MLVMGFLLLVMLLVGLIGAIAIMTDEY